MNAPQAVPALAATAQATKEKRRVNGGRALAEMFRLHGVGPMFGMAGFQLLPFYEAVRALGLQHHLINDERTGAFAADAYARVTGRPGVCDATLGPGATNLLTGLVESLNAGVPVIAVTGNSNRQHSWKNMTQEARQVDMLRPAVKDVLRVEVGSRIPELVRRAYTVATSGRPGPVVLDVPEDICHGEWEYDASDFHVDPSTTAIPARRMRPAREDVTRAAQLIARAERPLLLVGGGIHLSFAHDALLSFARAQGIPVAHTTSGKGAIACSDPLSAGVFGRFDRIANALIAKSDCLIVVGCKLGEIATKRYALIPPHVPIVHVDISAEELGRTHLPTVGLWGDAREGLRDLEAELSEQASAARAKRADYLAEVARAMAEWKESARARYLSDEKPIGMARLIHEIRQVMPADGILVADGGFAAHWTSLLYDAPSAGRTFVADRGFASIGYGVPGSLGAQLGAPARTVIGLTGDGGLNMSLGELETAVRAGAPFTLVVVNNAASGYVKALQHAVYGPGNYQSSDLREVNYAAVARELGCRGIRVEDPAKLNAALREAVNDRSAPTVVDVVVTRDPARMLPAADSRTLRVAPGDRPV